MRSLVQHHCVRLDLMQSLVQGIIRKRCWVLQYFIWSCLSLNQKGLKEQKSVCTVLCLCFRSCLTYFVKAKKKKKSTLRMAAETGIFVILELSFSVSKSSWRVGVDCCVCASRIVYLLVHTHTHTQKIVVSVFQELSISLSTHTKKKPLGAECGNCFSCLALCWGLMKWLRM